MLPFEGKKPDPTSGMRVAELTYCTNTLPWMDIQLRNILDAYDHENKKHSPKTYGTEEHYKYKLEFAIYAAHNLLRDSYTLSDPIGKLTSSFKTTLANRKRISFEVTTNLGDTSPRPSP